MNNKPRTTELAMHIQHILTFSFHLGKSNISVYHCQSPLQWVRQARQPPAISWPPPGTGMWSQLCVGIMPVSMLFVHQAKILKIASRLALVHSFLRITVKRKRFDLVVPVPSKEFQESTIRDSCSVKPPPSPCSPMGIVLPKIPGQSTGCFWTNGVGAIFLQNSRAAPGSPQTYFCQQPNRSW